MLGGLRIDVLTSGSPPPEVYCISPSHLLVTITHKVATASSEGQPGVSRCRARCSVSVRSPIFFFFF
jgi:hypothetical protein